MGIYDRSYMREDNKLTPPAHGSSRKKKEPSAVPLWNRLLFRLWLIFHPGKGSSKKAP